MQSFQDEALSGISFEDAKGHKGAKSIKLA